MQPPQERRTGPPVRRVRDDDDRRKSAVMLTAGVVFAVVGLLLQIPAGLAFAWLSGVCIGLAVPLILGAPKVNGHIKGIVNGR